MVEVKGSAGEVVDGEHRGVHDPPPLILLRSTFLLAARSAHNGSVIYRSIRNCMCNDMVEGVIDNMELPPGDIKWNDW